MERGRGDRNRVQPRTPAQRSSCSSPSPCFPDISLEKRPVGAAPRTRVCPEEGGPSWETAFATAVHRSNLPSGDLAARSRCPGGPGRCVLGLRPHRGQPIAGHAGTGSAAPLRPHAGGPRDPLTRAVSPRPNPEEASSGLHAAVCGHQSCFLPASFRGCQTCVVTGGRPRPLLSPPALFLRTK